MNVGKEFETQIKNSVPVNMYYLRLKDSPQSFKKSSSLRFTLKNPFDIIIYNYPFMYCFELKSTKSTSISFCSDNSKSTMIKKHQIEGLYKAANTFGVIAGFILNFRKNNQTYFLNILDFNKMVSEINKKSFNENDLLKFGAILINQEKKRTRYVYDLENLFKSIKDNSEVLKNGKNKN